MRQSVLTWFDPKEKLPEIPENRYCVSVLMIVKDVDKEEVYHGVYGSTYHRDGTKLQMFERSHLDFDFQTLYLSNSFDGGGEYGPLYNPVLLWTYIPKFNDIVGL